MRRDRAPALASTRLTLAVFALLGAGVVAARFVPEVAAWLIAMPLALLAANLVAAIVHYPRLRSGGLGVFHLGLLAAIALAAWGRLAHFDGHVNIVDGQEFDAAAVQSKSRGPLHRETFSQVVFRQGPFEIDYAPGVQRGRTRSEVFVGPDGRAAQVGDDSPLVVDGYRFYTTPNKGFAPLLAWQHAAGAPVVGAVMLPPYPGMDWQQFNDWTAPDGTHWKFALRVPPLERDTAWTLAPSRVEGLLVVEAAGQRFELRAGGQARVGDNVLTFVGVRGWMGYRIFYDPTLVPLFALVLVAIGGLAWHVWARGLQRLQPLPGVPA